MAKTKTKTTGQPAPSRRDPNRKYLSRAEREARVNRIVQIVAGVIFGLITIIVASVLIWEGVIIPNQAVANVGGQNISTRDFQRRVVYERWRSGNFLTSIINQFGGEFAQQLLGNTQNPYGQAYAELSDPTQMGRRVLDDMTNEILIKQYAQANNITVNEDDINKRVNEFFQYQPTPMTATPTITPTTTPTPLVSATPTQSPTPTTAPTHTPTLTNTPFPTGLPTATPGATEQAKTYQENSKRFYEEAAKATGFSQDEIRQIFTAQALREKVVELIIGEIPEQQDQIDFRNIRVATEEQAKDVMSALQQGELFASIARALSTDTVSAPRGGEYDWTVKDKHPAEIEAAIWAEAAKVGDVLGPIKTEQGFDIIQLQGREKRFVPEGERDSQKTKQFDDWLKAQGEEKKTTKYDYWIFRVPSNPTLEQLGLPSFIPQSGGGGFGLQ